jgi:hypothetical protein
MPSVIIVLSASCRTQSVLSRVAIDDEDSLEALARPDKHELKTRTRIWLRMNTMT